MKEKKKMAVTINETSERIEKGVNWFNQHPNSHKAMMLVAGIFILALILIYSFKLFVFSALGWLFYCIGKRIMKPKVHEKKYPLNI
jgi:type III secretory pathway component EscV